MVTVNSRLLLVQHRPGDESCSFYWLKATSVIFNICNNNYVKYAQLYSRSTFTFTGVSITQLQQPECMTVLKAKKIKSIPFLESFFSVFVFRQCLGFGRSAVPPLTTRCRSAPTRQNAKILACKTFHKQT